MPNSHEIKAAIEEAAGIAEDAPEGYRQAAFTEVLRVLLGSTRPVTVGVPERVETVDYDTTVPPESVNARTGPTQEWEQGLAANLPHAATAARGNRSQQTVWAVIRLWSQGRVADRDAVRSAIKTELGVTPQGPSNTSTKLRQLVPTYLNREEKEDSRGYVYSPTRNALDLFNSSE